MEERLYSMAEAIDMTGLKGYQIREYEKRLGLIFQRQTKNNNRVFAMRDIDLLKSVDKEYSKCKSYEVVKFMLDSMGVATMQVEKSVQAMDDTPLEQLTPELIKVMLEKAMSEAMTKVVMENQEETIKKAVDEATKGMEKAFEKYSEKVDQLATTIEAQTVELAELRKKKGFWGGLFGK